MSTFWTHKKCSFDGTVTITVLVICRCRRILTHSAEGHLTQHLTLKWTAGTVCRFSVSNPQTWPSPSHRLCSLSPFSFSYINAGHVFPAQFYCLKTIFNINNGYTFEKCNDMFEFVFSWLDFYCPPSWNGVYVVLVFLDISVIMCEHAESSLWNSCLMWCGDLALSAVFPPRSYTAKSQDLTRT